MSEDTETVIDTDPVVQEEPKPTEKPKTKSKATTEREMQIDDPKDHIIAMRKENASLRAKLEELASKKAEELRAQDREALREEMRKDQEASVAKEIAKIQRQARDRSIKLELKNAATKAGVIDFDDLFDIMKRGDTLKAIEVDEDDEVTNADELIQKIKETKGHLFSSTNTSSTARSPRPSDKPTLRNVVNLSRDDYDRAKAELANL